MVSAFNDIDEAIKMAIDSRIGLLVSIFTQNLDWAMRFAKAVHAIYAPSTDGRSA